MESNSSNNPIFAILTIFRGERRLLARLTGHSLSQVPHAQQRLLADRVAVSMTLRSSLLGVNMESIAFTLNLIFVFLVLGCSVVRRTPIRKELLSKGGLPLNSNPKKSKVNRKIYYFTRFSKNAHTKARIFGVSTGEAGGMGTGDAGEGGEIVVRC